MIRARVARLEAEAAVSVPRPSAAPVAAEMCRLREELADARGTTAMSGGIPRLKKRMRVDIVPSTVEEEALWL